MILSDFWYPLEVIGFQLKCLVNAGPSCLVCTVALIDLLTASVDLQEEQNIITRGCTRAYDAQVFTMDGRLEDSEDDEMSTYYEDEHMDDNEEDEDEDEGEEDEEEEGEEDEEDAEEEDIYV